MSVESITQIQKMSSPWNVSTELNSNDKNRLLHQKIQIENRISQLMKTGSSQQISRYNRALHNIEQRLNSISKAASQAEPETQVKQVEESNQVQVQNSNIGAKIDVTT